MHMKKVLCMTHYRIITWFDFPATLQYHTTPWNRQCDHFTIKPEAHFYIFFDVELCGIKFLHNLYWEKDECLCCMICTYRGHTYSAVRIKVLCDHKVHSAVIYSFTGVHLPQYWSRICLSSFQGLSISFRLS